MRKYGLKALAIATAMSMAVSAPLQVFAKQRANTAGSWKQSGENWSFQDEKGQTVLGWIYENGSWSYIDPKTGNLHSGWLDLADGSRYFFSNRHDGSFGKMLTGWNWIDGNCYYFGSEADESEGKLAKGGTTPDGYRVDQDGKWVDENGVIQTRAGEGYDTKHSGTSIGKRGSKVSSGKRSSGGSHSSGRRGGGSGGSGGGSSHKNPVEPTEPTKPVKPEEQTRPTETEEQTKPAKTQKDRNQQVTEDGALASPSNPARPTEADKSVRPTEPDNTGRPTAPATPTFPAENSEQPDHPTGPVEPDLPGKPEQPKDKKSTTTEAKSRMVHLGFADFVTVVFRTGTLEDHSIYVDDVDVTEAVQKVDDAGRIVKWATTVVSPKVLRVVNKADGSTEQTVRLNAGAAAETVRPGNPADQPDYILSRGRVSKFDYYLAPKDKEGNDRILPVTTTFDLTQERKENSNAVTTQFYVKPVVIGADGRGVEKDNIVIKFNVENEEQKKWFEGIDSLKILNSENWPVNQGPTFTTEVKDTKHGRNGIIQIPTGQDNMRSRGIYRVNIHSSYTDETVTVPFELVSSAAFSLKQRIETANPKAGERVQFNIEAKGGESFGNDLKIDSMRVTLKKPSGKVVELKYIDDFFNFGDLFVLYGKSSNAEKTVNTDEVGIYTLSLKYSGYQPIKTKFEVFPGKSFLQEEDSASEVSAKREARKKPVEIDAISSATTGSVSSKKSSGGSSGGGQYVDGRMVFNYDLLTNALILNEIEALNEDARAVVKRYFNTTESDYIYEEGADKLYSFRDYLDAYKEIRLLGGMNLNFKDYAEGHSAADYAGPNEVQNVLEDGSLGALTSFKFYKGEKVPVFTGTTEIAGNDFVLHTDNAAYLGAIQGIYLDGESRNLMDAHDKQYVLDQEAGTLTIRRGAFNFYNTPEVGLHTLKLEAGQKYRAAKIKLRYTAAEALPTLALVGEAKQNADVTVTVEGMSAEKLNAKLSKVELASPETSGVRTLLTAAAGGTSSNDYYEISGNQLTLKGGLFGKPGSYMLYLKFSDAKRPVTLAFTVAAAGTPAEPEVPKPTEKAAPESAALNKEQGVFGSTMVLSFSGMEAEELHTYLSKITELKVNDSIYQKSNFSFSMGERDYVLHSDSYGRNDGLKLGAGALKTGENQISVKAEGYAEKQFTVQNGSSTPDSPVTPEEPAKKAVPTGAEVEKISPRQGYDSGTKDVYDVTFTGLDTEALDQYLRAKITKLTVNGKPYRAAQSKSYLFSMDDSFVMLFDRQYKRNGVRLSANAMTETSNEVVLEVEGYETFHFTVERREAPAEETGKAVPTGAEIEKLVPQPGYDSGTKPAYALSFAGLEANALDAWLRSDSLDISVNGKKVRSTYRSYIFQMDDSYAFELSQYKRKSILLSGNLFASGSNEVTVKADGYQLGSFTVEVE